jgi:hypothetical protein
MERKRLRQTVRPLLGSGDSLDLELEPIAFLEVMNAPVEGE